MSILDSAFKDKQTMEGALAYAMNVMQEAAPQLPEETRALIEATRDGSSLGDVLGITKDQKNALFDLGAQLIQVGELDKATDVMMRLNQLDPLDERAMYALGLVSQMRNELHKAAQMYLQFLALDATNPLGYLRLGECLLAAKEYAEARGAFEMAQTFAAEGKGQPGNLEEAERMLALPEIAGASQTRQ